jgi:hypothetical protein
MIFRGSDRISHDYVAFRTKPGREEVGMKMKLAPNSGDL